MVKPQNVKIKRLGVSKFRLTCLNRGSRFYFYIYKVTRVHNIACQIKMTPPKIGLWIFYLAIREEKVCKMIKNWLAANLR